jgi:methionine-gamma-lyase
MAGPWTGWLLMRSLETLKVRMDQQAKNAKYVAEFLNAHPLVESVYYLGNAAVNGTKKERELIAKQYKSYGAMIAFDIKGGEKEAFCFLDNLKLIKLAVSLGGTESLAEHPQTMTHADVDPEDKVAMNITEKLIRLSIGVENYDDLISDLKSAFDQINH